MIFSPSKSRILGSFASCVAGAFALLLSGNVVAQTVAPQRLSLSESIAYAHQHNVQLRQAELTSRSNLVTLEQSRWLKYPSANGFSGLNGNFGRNVDPFTNGIVTQAIATNNVGVASDVTLYNGYRIKNTVALNELNVKASDLDVEAVKNNITLNLVTAYLNALSAEDQIDAARKQLDVTKLQLDRTQKLVNGGALPEVNLFDLNAQIANDELRLVNAQNSLESALLALKQVMNMPADVPISVVRMAVGTPSDQAYPQTASQIYENAVSFLPEVAAAAMRVRVAEKNIDLARSSGQPNVTASTSWGSAYSSAAKSVQKGETKFQQIPVSATVQGQTVPFVLNLPQDTYTQTGIPYFNQLGNNQRGTLGVSANIPIFNAYTTKYRVEGAKVQRMQAQLQEESTKLTIRQNIDQAYIAMLNAAKNYSATQAQVTALERAFAATDKRYSAGATNFTEYNLAKTRLDQATTNLIQAKYNYVFRTKILDFYQNRPLN